MQQITIDIHKVKAAYVWFLTQNLQIAKVGDNGLVISDIFTEGRELVYNIGGLNTPWSYLNPFIIKSFRLKDI